MVASRIILIIFLCFVIGISVWAIAAFYREYVRELNASLHSSYYSGNLSGK